MIPGFRIQWPITPGLAMLRQRVHAFGAGGGLSGQRLQDMVLAAHEAATNVLRHSGGRRHSHCLARRRRAESGRRRRPAP